MSMCRSGLAKDAFNVCRRLVIPTAAAVALAAATPGVAGTTYNVSTVPALQAAINAVNAGPGGDLIVLAPGFYAITTTLTFSKDVTIQGDPLTPTMLDGGGKISILNVRTPNFSVENLTLQNAITAIGYEARGVFSGTGLTITGSQLGFYPGDSGGSTFFTNSTIANNSGKGIDIACAAFHLTNVTISNNGVGVYFDFPCGNPMQITNSLIVGNRRDCGGGGGFRPMGDASFDSDGSCVAFGFGPGMTTKSLSAIALGGLASNGGPTLTEAIPATSAAVNAGNNTVCPATDQRGFLRNDGACDIGAYEYGAAPPGGNTPTGANVSVSPAPGVTVTFSQVTGSGNTTATTGGAPPPTGFKVDGVLYDISTTAVFTGSVTICLPFNPLVDPSPQLYHYESVPPPPAWVNRTTSVDQVKHIVCGTAPSLSPFVVLVTVPFASFTARVEIEHSDSLTKPKADSFKVSGRGTLGPASDGIAPDTEQVMLSLGSFSLTIPAGSFVKKMDKDEDADEADDADGSEDGHDRDDRITTYRFRGVIAGVSIRAEIVQGPKNKVRVHFKGRAADLGPVINPVTVGLAIGDDMGAAVVTADIDR
jgi:hypothetical protein